ncbi:GNAT family N-acetyltransferase [Myceligenerans pegani]|uniref:GNAT family N-acetyltransferase n=1 Tax=Myceligenerans pegani TaxID=2776917 RepID=A0ABR9MYM9_9MICO|nr:GNAT family N-acetyltransferase [Myceligenerans sp. TRM 65318]MBE1875963.1 GNAT family N-acetyltransferase [Myceligenerans sp. TRM 65318]MBE3018234.1 GNAT family N-acetyltransferase [Myceligenerans sp. TRM 65318]
MVADESKYEFSADTSRIDPARVHALLSEYAYWAAGRSRETQDAAIAGSRNYAVYVRESGELVGYARVVTDAATFGWLADVVVDPGHRRRGLARLLVEGALADLAPLRLARIVLRASDEGRALYEDLGWKQVDGPHEWMQRLQG